MDLNHTLSGLVVLSLCFFISRFNGVQGKVNLSQEEHLELEKQLKLLNKPAIKTIKTAHGQIFDCVDFYKQPAFDHVLLKNHSYHIKMKPRFPIEKIEKSSPQDNLHFGLKGRGCPRGTVPIKRITKEDLIRQKFASKDVDLGGTYKAVAYTKNTGEFTGAIGVLSAYKPHVQHPQQYSSSRIRVQNENEFIEFGLRVDPTLYGNERLHLYVQTNISTMRCFDTRCGFVVKNRQLSPGLPVAENGISTIGGTLYTLKMRVQRDNNGDWWLKILNSNRPVGFWPGKLFTNLFKSASYIEWGGEVYSPHYVPVPQMGSGNKPMHIGNDTTDAFFRWIAGIDASGNDFDPDTVTFNSDTRAVFYDVRDVPTLDPIWGHIIFFGGHTV